MYLGHPTLLPTLRGQHPAAQDGTVCQAEPKPLLATECDRGFSLLTRVRRFTAELI